MMQGLPLMQFLPGLLKEGSSVTAYNGTLSYFNRAPHPNAAKVAVNWLLSREGQTAWLMLIRGLAASMIRCARTSPKTK